MKSAWLVLAAISSNAFADSDEALIDSPCACARSTTVYISAQR